MNNPARPNKARMVATSGGDPDKVLYSGPIMLSVARSQHGNVLLLILAGSGHFEIIIDPTSSLDLAEQIAGAYRAIIYSETP